MKGASENQRGAVLKLPTRRMPVGAPGAVSGRLAAEDTRSRIVLAMFGAARWVLPSTLGKAVHDIAGMMADLMR